MPPCFHRSLPGGHWGKSGRAQMRDRRFGIKGEVGLFQDSIQVGSIAHNVEVTWLAEALFNLLIE